MAEERSADGVLSAREQALKEIADRRRVEADAEAAESVPEVDENGNPIVKTDPPAAEEKEGEEELSLEEAGRVASEAAAAEDNEDPDAPSSASPSEPPSPPQFDPEQEYELVVEGNKIKVKGSQIIERGRATLQKEVAAEYKLQLASELLEEAKRRAAVPPPGGPAAPEERPNGKTPTDEADDAKLAEQIQYGTKEQAMEAIKQLRTSGRGAEPEQVMQFVSQQLGPRIAAEIEFRNAAEMVKRDYSDLMGNDYLRRLFYVEENRRRAPKAEGGEGDTRTPSELYRSIGDDLRKAFNLKPQQAPKPSSPAPKTLDEKQKAKEKTPVVPSPASARVEGKGPSRPPTHTEIIDKMRKNRHQRPLTS